jgi:peptidylprolyl isomerase
MIMLIRKDLIAFCILIGQFFGGAAAFADADKDKAKLWEALGHMIGKNLQSLDVPLDMAAIAKGLQDEAAGLTSPMSEDVCIQTLMNYQREKNLQEAEAFLDANKKREGMVALEGGKLQYEILKKGKGQQVQSYNSPFVRLKQESEFSESDYQDEILALDEAMEGLRLGIIGMKEGEIRKLYIHPDLAIGEHNPIDIDLQNVLLIIEVEMIEADASSGAHAASNPEMLPAFRDLDDVYPQCR